MNQSTICPSCSTPLTVFYWLRQEIIVTCCEQAGCDLNTRRITGRGNHISESTSQFLSKSGILATQNAPGSTGTDKAMVGSAKAGLTRLIEFGKEL